MPEDKVANRTPMRRTTLADMTQEGERLGEVVVQVREHWSAHGAGTVTGSCFRTGCQGSSDAVCDGRWLSTDDVDS